MQALTRRQNACRMLPQVIHHARESRSCHDEKNCLPIGEHRRIEARLPRRIALSARRAHTLAPFAAHLAGEVPGCVVEQLRQAAGRSRFRAGATQRQTLGRSQRARRAAADAIEHLRQPTLLVLSAIDNLMKGAAGQALQNANLMLGLDEAMGLPA